MAELPAKGKLHDVDDVEADEVVEASSHGLLHNEALGRVIRNMYVRIQFLEAELKKAKASKRSVSP
jgi:hypothetical protein